MRTSEASFGPVIAERDAVDADDRDVDDVRAGRGRGRLQQLAGAPHIGAPEPGVSRAVHHYVGTAHGLGETRTGGEVSLHHLGAIDLLGTAAEDAHLRTALREQGNHLPAQRTGTPGHQDRGHLPSPPLPGRGSRRGRDTGPRCEVLAGPGGELLRRADPGQVAVRANED
jgi:hypothetical protein